MPHAVIFDIDGVLVDSYRAHFESWRRLAAERGLEVTEAMFAACFGRTSRDIIRGWWGDAVGDAEARALDERKEALYRDIVRADFPAMDGAVELIESLHAGGFKLAVGSSGPPANVDLVLAKLNRDGRFSAKVTGEDVTRGKPDPQVFLVAAKRLGVPPGSCAVVEDAKAGVAAANAAGMASIGLTGTTDRAGLAHAKLVVASLRELTAERIKRLLAS